jgi:hypothetical protein
MLTKTKINQVEQLNTVQIIALDNVNIYKNRNETSDNREAFFEIKSYQFSLEI